MSERGWVILGAAWVLSDVVILIAAVLFTRHRP
jgi:hypothetical protein